MLILACVDIHGNYPAIKKIVELSKKVDVVIFAGDISIFGNEIDLIFHEISKINKPVLIIPGNHETNESIIKYSKKYPNIVALHEKTVRFLNYTFVGFGGGGFSTQDREFEKFIKSKKETIIDKDWILVTHAPPYGTKLDFIYNNHVGNKSITNTIKELVPILSISGHIHETHGKENKIGVTRVINPGQFKVINL